MDNNLSQNHNNRKAWLEILGVTIIMLAATLILTPRFWEPGGESWPAWAAARILRDTGHFHVFSRGPVYYLYLQLFYFIKYPFSIKAEYLITYIFCYVSIYLMLRSLISRKYSLLMTCVWIPLLAITEGGATIAGMGFLALYLRGRKISNWNNLYFPPFLLISIFCHTVYLPFLIGHIVGMIIEKYRNNKPIFAFPMTSNRSHIFSLTINTSLLVLLILTILFPVRHPHLRNHMMIDPTYSPVPLKGNLTTSFFHIGTYKWVMRNIPESERIYHDWYFNKVKAFGDGNTIVRAILDKPNTFIENFVENLHVINRLPIFFLGGSAQKITFLSINFFLLVCFIFIFIGMLRNLWDGADIPLFFSVLFGFIMIIGALLLTSFNVRYYITLLPIGLLLIANIDKGLEFFFGYQIRHLIQKKYHVLGIILILFGIFTNEWFLPQIILRKLTLSYRVEIWILNIFFIFIGLALLLKKEIILKNMADNPLSNNSILIRNIAIIVSSICVLSSVSYSYGWKGQLKSIFVDDQPFLCAAKTDSFSIVASYKKIISGINKNTNILAYDEFKWLIAFTDVDLKNIHQMHSLPPFEDISGAIDRFLNKMDVIWVSIDFAAERYTFGASKYLRYNIHVKPFLEKALKRGWTVEEVKYFGKIYRRPVKDL